MNKVQNGEKMAKSKAGKIKERCSICNSRNTLCRGKSKHTIENQGAGA